MKKQLGIIAVCFAVSGCTAAGSSPQATAPQTPAIEMLTPIKLTPADVSAIQRGVRSSLKDPDSAKFGGMTAGKDTKGVVSVCLHVNAKNSYGGYTGMKPMLGILAEGPPKGFVVVTGGSENIQYQDQATYSLCGAKGLTIPSV